MRADVGEFASYSIFLLLTSMLVNLQTQLIRNSSNNI